MLMHMTETVPDLYRLQEPEKWNPGEVTVCSKSDETEAVDEWVLCRNCATRLAKLSDRINISDSGSHYFQNPAGIFFRVVSFSSAPGCILLNEYTHEHSWFAGFMWCIALCGGCGIHTGWHYISPSSEFFGLVADRLTGL